MNITRPALALGLMTLTACTQTWVEPKYQQPDHFAAWSEATPSVYRIMPGDDLSVVLPFNAELNFRGSVAPDGSLTMPFAGTIPAAGLTVAQLADSVNKALATGGMAKNGYASVSIIQSAAKIYVGGQVGRPGEIALHNGMSVMQAIMAAQGLLDTARTNEVVLIRRSPDGREMLRTIDIDALTHRGDSKQDVVLQAADTIFVPKSSIAEVDQWIDQYIDKVIPFNRGFDYTISNNPTWP
ncbi:polysaccharide biosynthesis/export family protein [Paraburkholderia unamae]